MWIFLPFYVSHYVHFDCIELMMEVFERQCRIHVGFSYMDSSSNCDDADVMEDVVAAAKLWRKSLIIIHQILRLSEGRRKDLTEYQ